MTALALVCLCAAVGAVSGLAASYAVGAWIERRERQYAERARHVLLGAIEDWREQRCKRAAKEAN